MNINSNIYTHNNVININISGETMDIVNITEPGHTISPELSHSNQSIHTNNICMARMKSNLNIRCSKIKKPNCDFCGIHMRAKNVIRFNEDIPKHYCPKINSNIIGKSGVPMEVINYDDLKNSHFNSKKFNYRHILYSLQQYKLNNLKNKQKNFNLLQSYLIESYNKNKYYRENIDKINILTKKYKQYHFRKINKARGIGYFNRSLINNTTDFLNFTDINDIPAMYLITFKDNLNFIYGFDIRSLLSYIEELDSNTINNPYTQKTFTKTFIDNIYILDNYNKHTQKINPTIHNQPTQNITPELKVKRLCVSIFQRMDELELYTQASWFLDLNVIRLKKLYFLIEDIWNYRARLTPVLKKKFVTNGIAFNWPIFYIKNLTNKIKIQNILLNEFKKFVYQGTTKADCVTASYWILMGLTIVSPAAASGCPSLVQSNH